MVELGWFDLVEVIWLCQVNLGWHGCVWLGGGWYGYVCFIFLSFDNHLISFSFLLSFTSHMSSHALPIVL